MEGSFHPFPRLPYEVRALIWSMTVEPRIVTISCHIGNRPADKVNPSGTKWRRDVKRYGRKRGLVFPSSSSTGLPPVLYAASPEIPGVLHACRESRALNLYEKVILEPEYQVSFAWVNYDVDTIEIGENEYYTRFWHCAGRVRRLRMRVELTEYWCNRGSAGLTRFKNLLECYIITPDDFWAWAGVTMYRTWTCAPENTFIIQENSGETKNCAELDEWWEELERRQDEEMDEDED